MEAQCDYHGAERNLRTVYNIVKHRNEESARCVAVCRALVEVFVAQKSFAKAQVWEDKLKQAEARAAEPVLSASTENISVTGKILHETQTLRNWFL